jgi:hypothetical protein
MAATPLTTRRMTIIAQDPAVRRQDRILTTRVEIPAEELDDGPWGYRVQVIDYDASAKVLYPPRSYRKVGIGANDDPYDKADDDTLVSDPGFHAQNVYAIVMRILARFEHALGRRVSWSFQRHQLKVAPHAFADANAFYSRQDEALLFGYFPGRNGTIYSCLSHDVVAHETTHALVDGLRRRYLDPSSSDQAAFHEGFADVIALLSVFALDDVVKAVIDRPAGGGKGSHRTETPSPLIKCARLTTEALRDSVLLGLAKEMGHELAAVRGRPLRQSAKLIDPTRKYLDEEEFQEPHRRGEIVVAAMMNAFLKVWTRRLEALRAGNQAALNRERVVEEGSRAADYLLTMAIRALDYTPPVHLEFGDFLSALLTADHEIRPDDSTYHFRDTLQEVFQAYGITPGAANRGSDTGLWVPPDPKAKLIYNRTRFESLMREPDEVFRFVWENGKKLGVYDGVYTRVISVRPCLRVGPDGFFLRETVAEYVQELTLKAREFDQVRDNRPRANLRKIKPPPGMPAETPVILRGGGTLIFDEYGQLKFNITNRLNDAARQTRRLQHLWDSGNFGRRSSVTQRFSHIHRLRTFDQGDSLREGWN